jgi:hypothetical protein
VVLVSQQQELTTDILSVANETQQLLHLTGSHKYLTGKTINSANNTLTIANAALVNSTITVTADEWIYFGNN